MKLLGIDPTDQHLKLYTAYADRDVRGFWGTGNTEVFLGTLVLALSQTIGLSGEKQRVVMAMPKGRINWATGQTKEVAKYVFRCRKGERDAILVLRDAFRQLAMASRILQITEPERWVAFGFEKGTTLPPWAPKKLTDG